MLAKKTKTLTKKQTTLPKNSNAPQKSPQKANNIPPKAKRFFPKKAKRCFAVEPTKGVGIDNFHFLCIIYTTLTKGVKQVNKRVLTYDEFKKLCLDYGKAVTVGNKKVNFKEEDLQNPKNAQEFNMLYDIVRGHNVTEKEFRSILSGAIKKGLYFGITDRDAYLVQNKDTGFITNNIAQLIRNYFDEANKSAFKYLDDICQKFKRPAQDSSYKKETDHQLIKQIANWVQTKVKDSDRTMIETTEERLKQLERFAKVYQVVSNEVNSVRQRKEVKKGEYSDLASHILGDRWFSCNVDSSLFNLSDKTLMRFINRVKNNPDEKERFTTEDVAYLLESTKSAMRDFSEEKYNTILQAVNDYKNTLLSQINTENAGSEQGEKIELSDLTCKRIIKKVSSLFLCSQNTIKQNFAFMAGRPIMEISQMVTTDKYEDDNPNGRKRPQSRMGKERELGASFPNLRLTEMDANLAQERIIGSGKKGRISVFRSISMGTIYDTAVALTNEFYALSENFEDKPDTAKIPIAQKKSELQERFVNIDEMITGYNIIDLSDCHRSVFGEKGEKRAWLHQNMQFLNTLMQPKYIQSIAKYNFLVLVKDPDQLKAEIQQIIKTAEKQDPNNADQIINDRLNKYFNLPQEVFENGSTDKKGASTTKERKTVKRYGGDNRVKIVTRSLDRANERRAREAVLREEIEKTLAIINEMISGKKEISNIKMGIVRIKHLAEELKTLDPEYVKTFVNDKLLPLAISIEEAKIERKKEAIALADAEEEAYKAERQAKQEQQQAKNKPQYKKAKKATEIEVSLNEKFDESEDIATLIENYIKCHPEVGEAIKRAKEGDKVALASVEEMKKSIKESRQKRLANKNKKEAYLEDSRSNYLTEYIVKLGTNLENAEDTEEKQ